MESGLIFFIGCLQDVEPRELVGVLMSWREVGERVAFAPEFEDEVVGTDE
jgi:hypothetical protein